MVAKRGVEVECIHFHTYPFTSEKSMEKVRDLARILAKYCGKVRLHKVNLLEIQKAVGVNTEQQSSSGIIDVSNVPIVLATSIISVLSIAINGLKTGMLTEAFEQVRPCIVCDATCPILSPVTKASHLLNLPTSVSKIGRAHV